MRSVVVSAIGTAQRRPGADVSHCNAHIDATAVTAAVIVATRSAGRDSHVYQRRSSPSRYSVGGANIQYQSVAIARHVAATITTLPSGESRGTAHDDVADARLNPAAIGLYARTQQRRRRHDYMRIHTATTPRYSSAT